ncbi:MAG: hypothetical protein ACE5LC_01345 [Candidatus Aminicenantales bacterium]
MKSYFKFVSLLAVSLLFLSTLIQAQKQQKEEVVKIPPEVKKVMDENLPARQSRPDIPLSYFRTLYFPYQTDYYSVFILKMKNRDMGYVTPGSTEKTIEEQEEEAETVLTCNLDFFFRVYSLDKKGEVKGVVKEIYLPYADQLLSSEYDPEEENYYTFGTIFPPGRYLLAAASASLDLSRIGLVFQEFYLPSQSDFRKKLGFTPVFFIKSLKRMPSPDSVILLYKNLFHYSYLEIEPRFSPQFTPQDRLDVFYFILGATPGEDGKYTFEIKYTYKKGEEEVVKFKPKVETIPAPIVSVPLQLSFSDKKLEPGEYTLEISLKDMVGRKDGKSTVSFFIE